MHDRRTRARQLAAMAALAIAGWLAVAGLAYLGMLAIAEHVRIERHHAR